MVPMRQRRFCFVSVAFTLVLYLCLSTWLADKDLKSVFYRVWYINGFTNSSESVQIACYYDTTHNTLPELETSITPDSSIFFLETSCRDSMGVQLTPRQACAVESAAKMNPEMIVYVLFPSPISNNHSAHSSSVKQLLTYPNVRLRHINMQEYFRDTPLEQWFLSGQLLTSRWPGSHASDILRYLTLWKFGGIYLDLDVVVTKYLADITNFAGAESSEDVAGGVLSFSKGGVGHKMATDCVYDLQRDFRGYEWGYNGPGVITRLLQRWCGTENVEEMTPERCKGFTVYPPSTFYPIPWKKWKLYFDSEKSASTLRLLASSKAIHVWNKFSTTATVNVGSKQPYGVIASKYCPRVYSHIDTHF